MKNKWIKRLIAIVVCVAIVGTGFEVDHLMAKADTEEQPTKSERAEMTSFDVTDENSSYPIKEETVFITTDASGVTSNIEVSEWLRNVEASEVLKDTTDLLEIENVNGEEPFMLSGNELNFQANGSDIYYRGVVDREKETPISLQISYMLDGVAIDASELDGKSGHLSMTIRYINNTKTTIDVDGESYDVCVPFAVTSMMMFPSDEVSHVTIENGKVIETGAYDMVLGFGFPGINESFEIEDGVFTDTVTIEADVMNYSVQTVMTYCSNDVFRDSDLADAVSVEKVTETLEEITDQSIEGFDKIDSVDALIDELDAKRDELYQMNDGAGEIEAGAEELSSGAIELRDNMILFDEGMGDAASGAKELSDGASYASSSAVKIVSGASQVSSGASSLNSGISQLYSGVAGGVTIGNIALNLSTGATVYDSLCLAEAAGVITAEQAEQKAEIEAGLTSLLGMVGTDIAGAQTGLNATQQATLSGYIAALSGLQTRMDNAGLVAGASSLATGAASLSTGASQLSSGLSTLAGGTNDLLNGINDLSSASTKLVQGTKDLAEGSTILADGTSEMKEGTQKLADLFEGDASKFVSVGKALQQAAQNYSTYTMSFGEEDSTVSFIIKSE